MTTAMKELGIDRMTVAARAELALDIWESLEGELSTTPLSAEDQTELERRDQDLDEEPDSGLTWTDIRKRIEAGE